MNKLNRLLLFYCIIYLCLLMGSCAPTKQLISESTTSYLIDTIVRFDTIPVIIKLPPDTVIVESTVIDTTKENADKLLEGKLNVGPWFAHSERSWAVASIKNNVPTLELYDLEVNDVVDVPVESETKIITKTVTDTKIETKVETKPFYKNFWFYTTLIMSLILVSAIVIKNKL